MATNRIKIEVDYENAVVKVNDLKLKFDELGERVTATRNRIKNAVKGTKDAIDGSVKSLMREKQEWQNVQASLSTTNEQYRKYQVQIDKIDAQIKRLTDTRKREEITLKNSANGLRQQIALIQQEMNNRKLSNDQYRLMQEEVEKLEARYNSLTNTVKEGTIAAFDQQIAALQREQREVATTKERIEELEQQITSLKMRKAELAGGTMDASKAMEGMSSSAGASGAVVTEFGRTIGDAPFGLMGMANNLQQLSQQFVDLQAKSGGTKQAFQSIMQTIMGPAGFVVAINIITSALVAYNMRKDKAKQKTEEFNDALILEKESLKALTSLYHQSADGLEARAKVMGAISAADSKYAEALDKIGLSEEDRNKLTEDYLAVRAKLNSAEDERNKFADENKELLSEEILSVEERVKIETQLADLWDQRRSAQTSAESNALSTSISQLTHRLKIDNDRIKVNSDLADRINAVADAEKEMEDVLGNSKMDQFIEKLAEFEKERDKSRELRGLEGSAAIEREIQLLDKEYSAAVTKYGKESVQAKEALLLVDEKRLELEQTIFDEGQERIDKEKDRLKELEELNQEYSDNLEAQGDELGLIRLVQQERDAIKEAKALGASQDLINKITQDFANQRQEILDDANEEEAEKRAKALEKQAKKEKKIREKALKDQVDMLNEYFDKEVEIMQMKTEKMSEIMTGFSGLLEELGNMSESRFQRQIGMLNEERDIIKSNDELTKEQKERQLTDLRQKENQLQRERINAEHTMFAIRQSFVLAEMVLKERASFRERQLLKQKFIQEQQLLQLSIVQEQLKAGIISGLQAQVAINSINMNAANNLAAANMSIGTYMAQLGPLGIAAFALSIGGVIASIVSSKRKAKSEIAALSDAPVSLGGGSSASAAPPDFNIVGASSENQLARAIAGSQSEPVRAYVVSSDVTTAQELDRKIVEGASI
jgi:hypothetical protein